LGDFWRKTIDHMQWEGAQIKGCEFHQNRQEKSKNRKKSGKAAGIGGIPAEL